MPSTLYFVGKPYPIQDASATFARLGLRIGLIQDKNCPVAHPNDFAVIHQSDFSRPDQIVATLGSKLQDAAGLLCSYENYIVATAVMAEQLGLPGQSVESARLCTDKVRMRDAFWRYNPGITPGFVEVGLDADVLAVTNHLQFPVVIKPASLVKSLFVVRCNNPSDLQLQYANLASQIHHLYQTQQVYDHEPRILVEEYMPGQLCSVAAFVDHTGTPHFCDGIAKLVNATEKGFDDNFLYARVLPDDVSPKLRANIFAVARAGVAALGITSTPAHIELIHDGHTARIVEIGARIGGYRPRMYQLSYGIDLIEQEAQLALGKQPDLRGTFAGYTGVFELFPHHAGTLQTITGLDSPQEFAYVSKRAQPGNKVGPAKQGYRAASFIIATAPTHEQFVKIQDTIDAMQVVVS